MSKPLEPIGVRLSSGSGLSLEVNANGSMRRFECEGTVLNLFLGNELDGGLANLYLRRHAGKVEWTPLLGPRSNTRFYADEERRTLVGLGSWLGVNYSVVLVLAQDAPTWFWHVSLENTTSTSHHLDLTYVQDVALASYGGVRLNEYYVSQYLDHTPLTHAAHGLMVASRQNLLVDGRNPWCLIGSLRKGAACATDALQFHGLATRAGETPIGLAADLPGRRLQHEHSMVVIRDAAIHLESQQTLASGFFGSYVPHHPAATSEADLEQVSGVLKLAEATPVAVDTTFAATTNAATLFSSAPALRTLDLDSAALHEIFGSQWRHEEVDESGQRLSFFYGVGRHVVLRAKELRVQRPHGHLLRTGRHMTPDESALTSTVWMNGVFHSMVTQGHVSINRFLSTTHTYLGLFRSHGQRVFVEIGGAWQLLDVPSAFEMSPEACRWIYKYAGGVIQVRAEARSEPHELTLAVEVLFGEPTRFLISQHVALNGDDGSTLGAARWRRDGKAIVFTIEPDTDLGRRFPKGNFRIVPLSGTELAQVGGDELLFIDGRSRQQPFVCITTGLVRTVGLGLSGNLIVEEKQRPLRVDAANEVIPPLSVASPNRSPLSEQVARIADIVPWFTHNALVHYLSPRGLEQYSGGGWGTRDVCQGPVEMLLALGRIQPIRDLLLRVMSAQNSDGDWPQWFMFFDRERNIRPGDSHGDIVFWPLVVLAQYLIASGDSGVLDERVPFFD